MDPSSSGGFRASDVSSDPLARQAQRSRYLFVQQHSLVRSPFPQEVGWLIRRIACGMTLEASPVTWEERPVMAIRVLIAGDNPDSREAMSALVQLECDIELVGAAVDPEEAIELAGQHTPDMVIVDVRMPGGGGRRAEEGIAFASPKTTVIALSAHDDASSVLEMFEGGVGEYLAKDAPIEAFIEAIKRGAR